MEKDGVVWRLFLPSVLLCLPAAALVGLGLFFLVDKVPKIVIQQRAALSVEYRQRAEAMLHEGTGERIERPKGWRQRGKLEGPDGVKIPWGYQLEGPRALVWIVPEPKGRVQVMVMKRLEFVDVEPYLAYGIPLMLAIFVLLTLFSVRLLVREAVNRDRFISATAHDLTTPLVGLRRTVGRDDAEAKRLIEQLMALVDNLKLFLRLGGRRPVPTFAAVNLREVYETTYRLFQDDFRDFLEGDDVEVMSDPDELPLVRADETLVRQILWNLLTNELKYAAPFGRVSIRFSASADFVRIDFIDEGKGLSARERRRIFRRYYRARGAKNSGTVGFGIGLATARELARAMGGDLRVSSHTPHGCIFSLLLARYPRAGASGARSRSAT